MNSDSSRTVGNPTHHHSTSLSGTSLQIPPTHRSQSSTSTQISFDQSKSRASTRQSNQSTTSNLTSVSAVSQSSGSTIKPYFYPTSGYPVSRSVLQNAYPGSGYPVSYLQHSYGYPSNGYPCCGVPEVVDLRSQLHYPSSEFPGGGTFPGQFDDDGSAPFINGLETNPLDPMGYVGTTGAFPGTQQMSSGPSVSGIYPTSSFDPQYDATYPV